MRIAPLSHWPVRSTPDRGYSRFRANYSDTLKLLEKELEQLSARDPVLALAGILPGDVRRDGQLRASARPNHPGVILQFTARVGRLEFRCDRYREWQENVRAIALTLEHLRAVDRYGVTSGAGEQYAGFRPELPANTPAESPADMAAGVLSKLTGIDASEFLRSHQAVERARGAALKASHPDTGGSHDLFLNAQSAIDVLRGYHGARA